MTKRGRPSRFTTEQLASITEAYYSAPKGKENKIRVLNEHGISIAQFYKAIEKLDIQFYVRVNGGDLIKATSM
ncbi:hypothetical protein [Providencia sp. JUb39]|uniref:hypothetical protein n=1 Tax=Providencia sp. JUb39 TaxID=2724165 RepID=UPI001C9D4084|nr:hypothetical protein [Providencia sp. JUb39]